MSVRIVYCGSCRRRIEPEEVEAGATLAFDNQVFCPDCRAKVMKGDFAKARDVHKPIFHVPPDPEAIRAKPLEGFNRKQKRPRTPLKGSRAARSATSANRGSGSWMMVLGGGLLGAGVLGLLLFLVIVGFSDDDLSGIPGDAGGVDAKPLSKRKSPGPGPKPADAGEAKKPRPLSPEPPDPTPSPGPAVPPADHNTRPGVEKQPRPAPDLSGAIPALDKNRIAASLGRDVAVGGRIAHARWSRSGAVLFLNFSDDRDGFYAVIFKNRADAFADAFGKPLDEALAGKTVRLNGRIESYKGRPQMKLDDPGQFEMVE